MMRVSVWEVSLDKITYDLPSVDGWLVIVKPPQSIEGFRIVPTIGCQLVSAKVSTAPLCQSYKGHSSLLHGSRPVFEIILHRFPSI